MGSLVDKELTKLLKTALTSLALPQVDIVLEHPANEQFGDYSTNVALLLYPKLIGEGIKKYPNPHLLATEIAKEIDISVTRYLSSVISAVNVAGPGFINFTLNQEILIQSAKKLIANNLPKPLKGQKIAVEYTDPNPFKEFHIGHLYSNIIGESIAKLYEANGATVWRGNFYGDAGMHIAKSVWGTLQLMSRDHLTLNDLEKLSLIKRQAYLGQGYASGVVEFDKSDQVKKEVKDINYLIYAASQEILIKEKNWLPLVDFQKYKLADPDRYALIKPIYQAGLRWSLDYFESYYQRLGTKFDGYYPESWVAELGLIEVDKGLKRGILEPGKDGAVIYQGEKDGLHTRVFRNRFGLPTYEAKDLGLVQAKYQDFKFDRSLNIFGQEINEYFKVVKRVMEQIDPDLGKRQYHLAHGMVNLPTGKMSSRSGNIITVEWLLNQARDLALTLIDNHTLDETTKAKVAETVGQAAVKYALLMSNIGDNVTFDFDKSVTFSGNSGPYLQYTHARCRSVLEKSKIKIDDIEILNLESLSLNPEELALLRWFYRYPKVIEAAAYKLAPHLVCTYLYELAQRYNTFYNCHTILGSADKPINRLTCQLRLMLTAATAQILANGLSVLGINAPDHM